MTRSKKTGRRTNGDPRKTGGNIAGPGGPHDRNSVIVDGTNAVLLDSTDVCLMETSGGSVVLAMLLEGRINKTPERARNLYLMNEDGAAALVSELIAVAHRIGPEFGERLMARVTHLLDTDAFTGEQGDPS
ncbi:hypothetical protein [Streptomyces sp. NPDC005303]|uniref:hypothetical protein n=1 Tax=Streptomyces sp. NPDC005303 TaxID=3155713 RepID=UPI0033B01EB4